MTEPGLAVIKRKSVGNLFEALSNGIGQTRISISKATGMSLMTIGKGVELLEEADALILRKDETSSAGRKSMICQINDRRRLLVIYSDRAVFTLDLMKKIRSCRLIGDFEPGEELFIEREGFEFEKCDDIFAAMLSALGDCGGEPIGIGQIKRSGERSGLSGIIPDAVENEITASAFGASREASSIYFKLGKQLEPIGSAIIIDRKHYRGANLRAGELCEGDGIAEALKAAAFLAPEAVRFEIDPHLADDPRLESIEKSGAELITQSRCVYGMAGLLISHWLDKICGVV